MTNLYVLNNPEGLLARSEKLEEEYNEVQTVIGDFVLGLDNKEHLAEECMDQIEVLLGIMDHAEINFEYAVKRHNEKLMGRGWKFKKKVFSLNIKDMGE